MAKNLIYIAILFFLTMSAAQAAYKPLTLSNGSTSYSKVRRIILDGNLDISNPSTGVVSFDMADFAADLTAAITAGAGDVTSSANITDHAIVRGDGGAKGIQQSAVIIDDSDNVTGVTSLNIDGTGTSAFVVDTNAFVVDASNNRVGLGSATPGDTLQVNGDVFVTALAKSNAEHDNGNCGAGATVDWNNGNKQAITLDAASCTLTFTAPSGNGTAHLLLKITQDGTGGRSVTWPGTVNWPNGTGINLSNGANDVDFVSCYYDGSAYYCIAVFNFG